MDAINNPPTLGSITFLTGPMSGTTYPITKPIITIGREATNDIVIATDASVSRHHAQLAWNNGTWSITKLAPQNTLMVNERDIPQGELHDRDMVRLGTTTSFRFQISNAQKPSFVPAQDQQSFPRQAGNVQAGRPPYKGSELAPLPPFGPPPTIEARLAGQGQPPMQGVVGAVTQRATLDAFGGVISAAPRGIPTLEVSTNTDSERHTYELVPTKQVFNIGRETSCDIVINRPTVSGLHAQILREGNQLVFVHPHPSRGKTLNGVDYKGRKIAGDEQFRHVLTHGDFFRITDEHGTFVTLTYNDGSGATQDVVPEIRPIPLGARELTLGRLHDNTVVLNHPQVSGHHARLSQVQGSYRIIDTNSTNHVYVNGKQVKDQVLKVGDEIRIGPFKLTYTGTQLTQHDESNSIRIDALHLKKTGNKQFVLINDISIAIPPRKFIALVGGSGAGKSTLLDALNGLRPAQDGVVLYNGQNYYQNLAAFSTQLGYVPQEDIIHRDITVEHALYYAAKMRLPDDFTEKQIKQRIEEVLDDVEMKSRRDLLVSKLSGGQRKRVSIALELLANPSVFFLDEPTSGLDPGLDRKMMLLLRKLADKGRTIVLVTHATNNINACDYVCFLCRGGRLAYYGPPEEAKKFFGKTDFAEIYSALEPTEENPKIPEEAEARFKASEDYQRYVVGPLKQGPAGRYDPNARTTAIKLPKRGNPWKQFSILSTRYLELLKNDMGNLLLLLLQAPIIGLILFFLTPHATFAPTSIATCFDRNTGRVISCQQVVNLLNTPQGQQLAQQQNKTPDQVLQDNIGPNSGGDAEKTLFIMAFAAVFFGCINGIREIVKEVPVFRRERTVNLGIAPYMFSKIVILGILCLLQSAVLVYMVNLADPIRQGIFLPPLVEIYITMALTSIAGLMLGLMVSSLTSNSDQAMSLIAPILLPQVIFAGVLFPLNSVPLQILGGLFAARWAMAGMGSSVGLHGDKLGVDGFSFKGTLFTSVNPSSAVPGAVAHLLLTWIILGAMIVIFGIAIAYFLKRKDVRA